MKKYMMLGVALPALFLAGCGDGWEAKLYDGFPYGNARTAGHGIEYVRANLMPERGPVLEAAKPADKIYVAPEPPPVVEEPPVVVEEEVGTVDKLIKSGEKFFRDMQRK